MAENVNVPEIPEWWANKSYCYLTTTGRRTGDPHEIEIWFGVHDGRLYMISGRREKADWVKNLRADPRVQIRVSRDQRPAEAKVVESSAEHPARYTIAAKYRGWQKGQPLSDWAANASLVEVRLDGQDQ